MKLIYFGAYDEYYSINRTELIFFEILTSASLNNCLYEWQINCI